MNILINDFGGYAFTAQLSRQMARLGHEVVHSFCDSLTTTPKGTLGLRADDPDNLSFYPIQLHQPMNKYSLFRRFVQEIEYGNKVACLVRDVKPDVVISANTPLDAQTRIQRASKNVDAKFIFWLQDVLGLATQRVLQKKLPLAATVVGGWYKRLEKRLLRQSDQVVSISTAFHSYLDSAGVHRENIKVVENWAPLDDITVVAKENNWSRGKRYTDRFTFLYSGTLSLKHNPAVLLNIAESVADQGAVVIVRSQGQGADWLRQAIREKNVDNLVLEDYVPYEYLSESLASADVLVAILEPEASEFSVPSKVLTYMCTGRALMLAVPHGNLAAQIVRKNHSGVVIDPTDSESVASAAQAFVSDSELSKSCGISARNYAERTFNIESIANQFVDLLA